MRCDDDRPVHHLLRATATTSRDHLTRPPHATTTTFAIVHAHRSDVTSIHPSSAPPSSSSSRSVDRPTGTTPIEPFDRPFDRADRPTVRSSRSFDRSIEPFVRPFDRAVRPTASIPSHPIIPSHRAALSLEISRADDGHRVEDTWRTTHLHYGDSPPTHTMRSHPISLEVAISRAFTSHDSPRVLDRDTRVPHSTDHDSTRPPTSRATDRGRAPAVVGDATTSPRRHTRARVSYGPQTTRASDVRTEYTRTRALFTSTADARPIAR